MRHRRSLVFVAGLTCLGLGSCELWQVLTFSSHPDSGFKNSVTTVELISLESPGGNPQRAKIQQEFDKYCKRGVTPEFAPFLVPIATAVATFLIDKGSQAIQDWTQKKKDQFTTTAGVQVTPDAFLVKSGKVLKPAINCFVVKQSVRTDPSNDQSSLDEAFVFGALVVLDKKPSAFKLVPTFYQLSKATALTDGDSGKVDVDLKFVFNIVGTGDSAAQKVTGLGTAELTLKGLMLPKAGAKSEPQSAADLGQDGKPVDKRLGDAAASGWLPIAANDTAASKCLSDNSCTEFEPVTINVTMTETGTGSDAFGKLNKDVSDNTKTFETGITSALQNYLNPPKSK